MKYLKTYESDDLFNFEIGEHVICIYDNWPVESVTKNEKYIILEKRRFNGHNYYAISDINGKEIRRDNKLSFFGENVFSKIIDYNTSKYNL